MKKFEGELEKKESYLIRDKNSNSVKEIRVSRVSETCYEYYVIVPEQGYILNSNSWVLKDDFYSNFIVLEKL